MRDFFARETTDAWPYRCVACGRNEGRMVDSYHDLHMTVGERNEVGRVFCCELCVQRAGTALGYVPQETVAEMVAEKAHTDEHVRDLEARLAAALEEQVQVVSVKDLADLITP